MPSSTVLRRTPAGEAELATPSHGLSIGQRRILTLLDTPGTAGDLTSRGVDATRVDRDIARLVQAGLIAGIGLASPSARLAAGAESLGTPVRLGAPQLVRRLPLVLLPIAAGTLAWTAWQHLAPPAPTPARADVIAQPIPRAGPLPSRSADPVPIATRVLRSDAAERSRDAPDDARPPKAESKPGERMANPPGATPHAESAGTPIEHPSGPAKAGFEHADAHQDHDAAAVASRADPSGSAQKLPAANAPKAAVASDVGSLHEMPPAPTTPREAPAAEKIAPLVSPPLAQTSASPPIDRPPAVQVAALAPRTATAGTAAQKLVPISREEPVFPREAIMQHLPSGTVTARLTVDAQGRVSAVDIVSESHRAFDRAVRDALARWQFAPGAPGRTAVVDVAFKRD